jgi:citrate synthase
VISAAIATLAGPIHGGASEEVLKNLRHLASPERARMWAEENIRNQMIIAGFGHRAYKVKDPRAALLQKLASRLFEKTGRSTLYEVALELERVVEQHLGSKGVHANVDFFSGIIYDRLGIPSDLFTAIFSMSRVCGWLAHWNEQLQRSSLYRPTQIYIGDRNKQLTPLAERA